MTTKKLVFIFGLLFFFGCAKTGQNMLQKKWFLKAVAVSHADEGSLMDNDSTVQHTSTANKVITDTVRTEGSTDYFDFSDGKNYSAQLMGSNTNGTYQFIEPINKIVRHNESTNITDTLEVNKLSEDTLTLYEKENSLTLFLVSKK